MRFNIIMLTAACVMAAAPATAQTKYYSREKLGTMTPTKPATPPPPAGPKCEEYKGNSFRNDGTLEYTVVSDTKEQSLAACESYMAKNSMKVGICTWIDMPGSSVYHFTRLFADKFKAYNQNATIYASLCQ